MAAQGSLQQTRLGQNNDLLISTPTKAQTPTPRLPPYASDIPEALLQLPDPSIHQVNDEPGQVMIPEAPETPQVVTDLPQAVPVAPEPPGAPTPTNPINIAPTGTTCTGRQVRTPSRYGYAAYLAKTALAGIADLHPLACLQMVSADIQQPEGYPDAMPLEVALAQLDRDKFIGAMEKELKQHLELPRRCGMLELPASNDATGFIIFGTPVRSVLQHPQIKSRTGP